MARGVGGSQSGRQAKHECYDCGHWVAAVHRVKGDKSRVKRCGPCHSKVMKDTIHVEPVPEASHIEVEPALEPTSVNDLRQLFRSSQ